MYDKDEDIPDENIRAALARPWRDLGLTDSEMQLALQAVEEADIEAEAAIEPEDEEMDDQFPELIVDDIEPILQQLEQPQPIQPDTSGSEAFQSSDDLMDQVLEGLLDLDSALIPEPSLSSEPQYWSIPSSSQSMQYPREPDSLTELQPWQQEIHTMNQLLCEKYNMPPTEFPQEIEIEFPNEIIQTEFGKLYAIQIRGKQSKTFIGPQSETLPQLPQRQTTVTSGNMYTLILRANERVKVICKGKVTDVITIRLITFLNRTFEIPLKHLGFRYTILASGNERATYRFRVYPLQISGYHQFNHLLPKYKIALNFLNPALNKTLFCETNVVMQISFNTYTEDQTRMYHIQLDTDQANKQYYATTDESIIKKIVPRNRNDPVYRNAYLSSTFVLEQFPLLFAVKSGILEANKSYVSKVLPTGRHFSYGKVDFPQTIIENLLPTVKYIVMVRPLDYLLVHMRFPNEYPKGTFVIVTVVTLPGDEIHIYNFRDDTLPQTLIAMKDRRYHIRVLPAAFDKSLIPYLSTSETITVNAILGETGTLEAEPCKLYVVQAIASGDHETGFLTITAKRTSDELVFGQSIYDDERNTRIAEILDSLLEPMPGSSQNVQLVEGGAARGNDFPTTDNLEAMETEQQGEQTRYARNEFDWVLRRPVTSSNGISEPVEDNRSISVGEANVPEEEVSMEVDTAYEQTVQLLQPLTHTQQQYVQQDEEFEE